MPKDAKPQPVVDPLSGITKRQQIAKVNKAIFIWVAVASAIISLSIVALQFVVRQGIFNSQVIKAQSKTNSIVAQNIESAKTLKQNVDALQANEDLNSAKAASTDNNLKVILDALPTSGDTTTIANSLYSLVLKKSGVEVTSISVGNGQAEGAAPAVVAATTPAVAAGPQSPLPVTFSVGIKGSIDQVRTTLENIERVLRPFNITLMNIKAGANATLEVTINGDTYYLQESTVQLGSEVKKP